MAAQAVAEAITAVGVPPRPPPKRMARLPLPIPRAQVPFLPLSPQHTAAGGRPPTTTSPTRRTWVRSKRRRMTQAQPGKVPDTRHARMGATTKQASY